MASANLQDSSNPEPLSEGIVGKPSRQRQPLKINKMDIFGPDNPPPLGPDNLPLVGDIYRAGLDRLMLLP